MENNQQIDRHLERQLRQKIKGRSHHFSAVVPVGFETIAIRELRALQIGAVQKIAPGVVGWEGKIETFWLAHAAARTPVSIRWVVEQFRATGFGELQKKVERLPWQLYLPAGSEVTLSVAAQMSRLWHEGAVKERFDESLQKCGFHPSENGYKLLLHLEKNIATLSLHGHRTPLYHRGYGKKIATAPLRDNIAWGLLLEAGLSDTQLLYDPMSGSGTFSLEAALASNGHHPSRYHKFDFEEWPSFRPNAWEHLLKQLPPRHPLAPAELQLKCGDLAPGNCALISENFRLAAITSPEKIHCEDFLKAAPPEAPIKKLLLLNPPWGMRLEEREGDLYRKIGNKIGRDYSNWSWVVIVPSKEKLEEFKKGGAVWNNELRFRSGGITLRALFKQ